MYRVFAIAEPADWEYRRVLCYYACIALLLRHCRQHFSFCAFVSKQASVKHLVVSSSTSTSFSHHCHCHCHCSSLTPHHRNPHPHPSSALPLMTPRSATHDQPHPTQSHYPTPLSPSSFIAALLCLLIPCILTSNAGPILCTPTPFPYTNSPPNHALTPTPGIINAETRICILVGAKWTARLPQRDHTA
jgi:hypothetical protein